MINDLITYLTRFLLRIPLVRSIFNFPSGRIMLMIFLFGFLFITLGITVLHSGYKMGSASSGQLAVGWFFLVVGLLFAAFPLSFKTYEYDEHRLITKSLFGYRKKEVFFRDIISYRERIDTPGRYISFLDGNELIIHTRMSGNFSIPEVVAPNYDEILNVLLDKVGLPQEEWAIQARYPNWKTAVFFFLMSGLFISSYFYRALNKNFEVHDKMLKTLAGSASFTTDWEEELDKNVLKIRMADYPECLFSATGSNLSQEEMDQLTQEDEIELDVLDAEFDKTNIENGKILKVMGLRSNAYQYISLQQVNNLRAEQRRTEAIAIGIAAAICAFVGMLLMSLPDMRTNAGKGITLSRKP